MMSSPFPTLAVCLTYAYCVKVSHFSYVLYLHLYMCFSFSGRYFYFTIIILFCCCIRDVQAITFCTFQYPT